MSKTKVLNFLSNKYNIPAKYLKFALSSIMFLKVYDNNSLTRLEQSINWDIVKEHFEHDRQDYSSIFYGMEVV